MSPGDLDDDDDDGDNTLDPHIVVHHRDTNERVHHLLLQMAHVVELLDLLPNPSGHPHPAGEQKAAMKEIREEEDGAMDSGELNVDNGGRRLTIEERDDSVKHELPGRVYPQDLTGQHRA